MISGNDIIEIAGRTYDINDTNCNIQYMDYPRLDWNDDPLDWNAIVQNICKLKKLRSIVLSTGFDNVPDVNIPDEFWELTDLQTVSLYRSNIKSLSPNISNLTNVSKLILTACKFETFPVEICSLSNLEMLKVNEFKFTEIPKEIGNLTKLETLILTYNQIEILPDEINKLTKLKILNVSNNRIKSFNLRLRIGQYIFEPQYPYHYLLNGMEFQSSKENALEITSDDFDAPIYKLPPDLYKLTHLEILTINGTPSEDCDDDERYDELCNFKINEISNNICDLVALTELYLEKLPLESFPTVIFDLKLLNVLSMNNCFYKKEMPNTIKKLKNLHTLIVPYNGLSKLPDKIGGLKELKHLDLSNNELEILPKSIEQLKKLEILKITNNNGFVIVANLDKYGIESYNLPTKCNIIQDELSIGKRYDIIKHVLQIS